MSKVADDGTPVADSSRPRTDSEPLKAPAPEGRQPGDPEPGSISAAAQELARRRWAKQQEAEGQAETPAPEAAPAEAPTDEPPVADDPAEEQESDDAGAEEEGGPDESEGELASAEEESEESDDPAQEEPQGPLELAEDEVLIVNGEEVSFGDLVKGNLREADYTRRTQVLAQERDSLQQREQAVAAHFGQVERGIIGEIKEIEQNTNWSDLATNSPDEFTRLRTRHQGLVMELQRHQQQSKAFLQNIEQVTQAARAEQAKVAKAVLKESIPGWNDGMYYSLVNYAEMQGFQRQDVLKYVDPNIFVLMHKAKQFDEAQQVGTKKIVKASAKRNVRATAASTQPAPAERQQNKALDEARERAQKSGSIEDAVAVLRARRGGG